MKVTKETRLESYLNTDPTSIQGRILDVLTEPMTARQIAYKLGYDHPIVVRPRITELMKAGKIIADEKAYDTKTHRNVAIFRRADA